ncbi:hypothetical protein [Adhaeribacter soli]|uniref:Uncharacterized protein n=1 Tax=Adhaeribacter soli TaxID=2607655 RepID=A0A5N1JAC0_9BACT|nr:hypothetical protein [Adhaeribacter soli]KAA9345958.1 hypothetical protein F0P94_02430 [Adhaeribacter soli]
MKKNLIILSVLLLLSFLSCQTNESIQKEKKIRKVDFQGKNYLITEVDSSANILLESDEFSGVIFSKDYKVYGHFFPWISRNDSKEKIVIRFNPVLGDIVAAERILKRCIEIDKIDADGLEIYEGKIYDLPNYYRQYFGAINENDEKIIWVNCFLKPSNLTKGFNIHQDWKVNSVEVQDGGKAYFNIEINITSGKCYNFFRNSIGG